MSTLVKHDQTLNVQGHRSVEVQGNEIITVKGARSQTVRMNENQHFMAMRKMLVGYTNTEEMVGPHRGDFHGGRTEVVENGDSLTVVASDKTTMVDGEYNISANQHYSLQVGEGSTCIMDLKDGVTTIMADEEIRFVCGAASITLKKDGTVEIKGSKQVRADGADAKLELKSDGAYLDGKRAAVSGVQQTTITGKTVKIN
jgi:type VI secretion system secreted protein VgrG